MSPIPQRRVIDEALRQQRRAITDTRLALGDALSSIDDHIERCDSLDLTKLKRVRDELDTCGSVLDELCDRHAAAEDAKEVRDIVTMAGNAATEVAGRYLDLAKSEFGLLDNSGDVNRTIKLLKRVHNGAVTLARRIETGTKASANS
ncbi:MAG: hypothetical protein KGR26_02630 [Cyanobacteria bacterium REEB65]|nr:hypothetical protein [Cyanobacteria bacterium REEB65]